jgi:protein TonB
MFEDALLESGGKIRTHRGWFSGVAAACNGGVLGLLLLWPLLHPASLPRQTISMLIAAPAPPAPPAVRTTPVAATNRVAALNPFTAPQRIPSNIQPEESEAAPPSNLTMLELSEGNGALTGLPDSIGTAAPPRVRMAAPRKLAISSGVMEGRRLSGSDPRYPAIAAAAGVQGTVVLAATISKAGAIENLRVLSGPPMLIRAAEEAVQTWRYRPYLLNGEPVAVETTIHVIFHLGS